MSEILTVSDAARLLGVAADTVRYYERHGYLPAEKTPGGIRIFRRCVTPTPRMVTLVVAPAVPPLALDGYAFTALACQECALPVGWCTCTRQEV